jgi:hypothetical protein
MSKQHDFFTVKFQFLFSSQYNASLVEWRLRASNRTSQVPHLHSDAVKRNLIYTNESNNLGVFI